MRIRILFLLLFCSLFFVRPANAMIFINEILADPAAGLAGDANHDGIGSSSQDEFIELINNSSVPVNLSGWSIKDAVTTRHIFAAGTIIDPRAFIVVFGGGIPALPGVNVVIASTGTLSLNNAGDIVSLFDSSNMLIDQVNYGSEANHDQSLNRFPEGAPSSFLLHSTITGADHKLFSPGTTVNGEAVLPAENQGSAIPERPIHEYFFMGWVLLLLLKRNNLYSFA